MSQGKEAESFCRVVSLIFIVVSLVYSCVSGYVWCHMIRTTGDQDRNGRGYDVEDGGRWEGGVSHNSVTDGINYRRHYGVVGGTVYWPSLSIV